MKLFTFGAEVEYYRRFTHETPQNFYNIANSFQQQSCHVLFSPLLLKVVGKFVKAFWCFKGEVFLVLPLISALKPCSGGDAVSGQ